VRLQHLAMHVMQQVNYVKFYTIFQMFVCGMILKTAPKVVCLTYENPIS
jgi:hypothetical protein